MGARDSALLQNVQTGSETYPSNYSLGFMVGFVYGSKYPANLRFHCL